MNHQELRDLVDFHYWARDRMLAAVEPLAPEQFTKDLGNSFGSIRDTLAHLYFAEWIWLSRWQGLSPANVRELLAARPPASERFPDLATVRRIWAEHETKLRAFLDTLDDHTVSRVVAYTSMDGTPGSSIQWQMIQHVVNHASYHRGQVTTMLRQLGAKPPQSTDLITFYRERAGATRA
jgi:uncharacterized damage-inducible protein DinB